MRRDLEMKLRGILGTPTNTIVLSDRPIAQLPRWSVIIRCITRKPGQRSYWDGDSVS